MQSFEKLFSIFDSVSVPRKKRQADAVQDLCKQHNDDADDGYYGGEDSEAAFLQEFH